LPAEVSLDIAQPESVTDAADAPSAVDIALLDLPLATDSGRLDRAGSTDEGGVDVPNMTESVDTRPGEDPVDASYAEKYQCRDDSDCCIAVVRMRCTCWGDMTAYLYSRAPGAAPPPSPTAESCTACNYSMCPDVQVRCVSGQCAAKVITQITPNTTGYCGAGSSVDAGPAVSGPTSWQCTPPPG